MICKAPKSEWTESGCECDRANLWDSLHTEFFYVSTVCSAMCSL